MASGAERVFKTTDVDGNLIELHVGDTVFQLFAHVVPRTQHYHGAASWAQIDKKQIIAIAPKGDKIAFTAYNNRPQYEYNGVRYATTFAQAKRALQAYVAEIVAGTRAELHRATSLEIAVGMISEGDPKIALRDPREDPALDAAPATAATA